MLRLTLSQDDSFRVYVPLSQIPKELVDATLLQEDQYFRQHWGINPIAILHAAYQTYILKKRRFGASTISMQVARLRFHVHSKSILGKIQQILYALQLEMHYSKDAILEAYLNLAPYGGNIEGVAAASHVYFNKPVQDISLPEALLLSVIPQNPSKRTKDLQALREIRNKLFKRWLETRPEDQDKMPLMQLPLVMGSAKELPFIAPHFVIGLLGPGSKAIQTTLDINLQKILEQTCKKYIQRKAALGVYNAAVLLVDTRDLGIKGMLGSVDFFNKDISGQINGTEIFRSPGSTLKPFIYGRALDQGLIHPNTVLKDVPHSFGSYNPENFDNDFMGPIRARDALILSRNVPAIFLESQLGSQNLYQLLSSIHLQHLKSESYYGLALTLGGVEVSMKELVGLYAMLTNEGLWYPLRMQKNDKQEAGLRLLSPEASFLILDMLKDSPRPLAFLGGHLQKYPIAWKTGTSSGYRDAWSVGLFGPYALAVWVGNFDNKSNPAFVGKDIAAPLFFELVEAITHEKGSLPTFDKNPKTMNLVQVEVCKASGLLPTRYCQDREQTWFIPGKSPIKTDNIYREVAIDKTTGLRTCHWNENTRFEIFEFWPTDLLKIFKQAGIQRRIPPFFESDCTFNGSSNRSIRPQISSPQRDVAYVLSPHALEKNPIPLSAVVDADVRELYWFANHVFLGKSSPFKTFFWEGRPGKFVIRVVDDHGLSDARDITIVSLEH